jgi:hypothetical protein
MPLFVPAEKKRLEMPKEAGGVEEVHIGGNFISALDDAFTILLCRDGV